LLIMAQPSSDSVQPVNNRENQRFGRHRKHLLRSSRLATDNCRSRNTDVSVER
jgi:hypothetical protein